LYGWEEVGDRGRLFYTPVVSDGGTQRRRKL
jgi:hypothetical protein